MDAFLRKGLKHDNIKYQTLAQAFSDNETITEMYSGTVKGSGLSKENVSYYAQLKSSFAAR